MRTGVAVGFFDGVHLGHRQILAEATQVITFRHHPLSVVSPARAPRLIMGFEERIAAIRACGIENVVALDFTPELAALPPEAFAARYLTQEGTPLRVSCGANWRFGAGGSGNADFLRGLGHDVRVAPASLYAGEPISSTRIRRALEAGCLDDAAAMLGRPFALTGSVSSGKGLGTKLGFPTVNVVPESQESDELVRLPHGVYAASVDDARAVANFGLAPTAEAMAWKRPVLEVHFLDALPPCLPHRLTVDLHRFVRPERKFRNLAELQRQIAEDCRSCNGGREFMV